ncbi:hypothetical protein ABLG96_13775 [Nakamurella sp. A5-74]|uniref:LysM peptidoglycan-binding domain-containing protein n=1 Tax=Nakamurella sp. A5-74 TaxID=3158264 RepID=A0AAU8DLU8_9ACTN
MVTESQALRARRLGSQVAHLVSDLGNAYSLVFTPTSIKTGGFAPVFTQVARPGRKPLLVQDSLTLVTESFTHNIVEAPGVNVERAVTNLQRLAQSGRKVRIVGMNPMVRGWFNITSLSVTVQELNEHQRPKIVELTWELQQAAQARVKIGRPVTIRTMRDLEEIATTRGGSTARIHIVRSGESLRSIAEYELGDPDRWTEIADLNKEVIKASAVDNAALLDNTATTTILNPDGSTSPIPLSPAGPQFGGFDPDADSVPRRAITSLVPGMRLVLPPVQLAPDVSTTFGGGSRVRLVV